MFAKSGSPTWEAPLSSLQQQAPVLWLPVGFDQWGDQTIGGKEGAGGQGGRGINLLWLTADWPCPSMSLANPGRLAALSLFVFPKLCPHLYR